MLVQAAAREWGVSEDEITVAKGVVSHAPSGKSAQFGELVAAAQDSTPPEEPKLKDPADFVLIGKDVPRLDCPKRPPARRNLPWTSTARGC